MPLAPTALLQRMAQNCREQNLLEPEQRVVVGVSGGADSMALLHLLAHAHQVGLPLQLIVAHLNHGLRAAAPKEEKLVCQWADHLGLPCHVQRLQPHWTSHIEEQARLARYRFLHQVADTCQATAVSVAHTADDQVETILWRMLEGSGLRGLAGMPAKRALFVKSPVQLIRPLLPFRRIDLLTYLRNAGIPWCEDLSNQDLRFQRNRLRHEVLPFLEQHYQAAVRQNLLRLGLIARQAVDYLESQAPAYWQRVKTAPCPRHPGLSAVIKAWSGRVWLTAGQALGLAGAPSALLPFILQCALSELGAGSCRLHARHLHQVRAMAQGHSHGRYLLPQGFFLQSGPGMLLLGNLRGLSLPSQPLRLNLPGITPLPGGGRIQIQLVAANTDERNYSPGKCSPSHHCTTDLVLQQDCDAAACQFPFFLRTRCADDYFTPLGGQRTRLNHFLSKAGVPRPWRDILPLLSDAQDRVLWLPGIAVSEQLRVTAHTRTVLRMVWYQS